MGLDDSLYVVSDEFDTFIQRLKRTPLIPAPEVKVVTSQSEMIAVP